MSPTNGTQGLPLATTAQSSETEPEKAQDKTQLVMRIIAEKGAASSQEILKALRERGADVDQAYLYAVVSRQRKKGKLKQLANGQYALP